MKTLRIYAAIAVMAPAFVLVFIGALIGRGYAPTMRLVKEMGAALHRAA